MSGRAIANSDPWVKIERRANREKKSECPGLHDRPYAKLTVGGFSVLAVSYVAQ